SSKCLVGIKHMLPDCELRSAPYGKSTTIPALAEYFALNQICNRFGLFGCGFSELMVECVIKNIASLLFLLFAGRKTSSGVSYKLTCNSAWLLITYCAASDAIL